MTASMPGLTSDTRLYALDGPSAVQQMHVERWTGHEPLSHVFEWRILALSPEATIAPESLLGQKVRLLTTLADGSQSVRSGLIRELRSQHNEGALTRYYLVLVPWLWVLGQGRNSRVFEEQTVIQIVEQVLAGYPDYARWQFTGDARHWLRGVRPRSFCVQYRESDFDFIQRLLAEEGLGFRFVEDDSAPAGHCMEIFGDSSLCDEDPTSASATRLRFHQATGSEEQDTVQRLGPCSRSLSTRVTLLSHDYKTRQSTTDSQVTPTGDSGRESYDPVGYAFLTHAEARHYTGLHVEAQQADRRYWKGHGTVRSARSGTRFEVRDGPWVKQGPYAGLDQFVYTSILCHGVNNLPEGLPVPEDRCPDVLGLERFDDSIVQRAQTLGYAQQFLALPRLQRWRVTLPDGTGQRLNPQATALGAQTAIVVGPDGKTSSGTGAPLYCDARGRVRVRFHWQADDDRGASWVRVAQVLAGNGHGAQFLPRIGHEVLVQFMEGDMDRPIIVKSLYNGQGDAGEASTPGGQPALRRDLSAYTQARDHRPSAEFNRTGGNSPAWHGGGPADHLHRNQAALSGIKTQGFDGQGHNQLVFDDSNGQGRLQMATSQAHSQLNLGHLVHQAGNYRGSFRGLGFELRTDAYGAMRAKNGLLFSTCAIDPQSPAGDAAAAQTLQQQQLALAQRFDLAAQIHQTVTLAAVRGVKASSQSNLIADQPPLKALLTSLGSTVSGASFGQAQSDAPQRQSSLAEGRVPHSADPLLTLGSRASLAQIAGQSLHHHAGETLTLSSGQDSSVAIAGPLRVHSGQAIGYLAGAQQANGIGLSLISGAGALDIQAQQHDINVLTQDALSLTSINGATELAAGKAIVMKVEGGASLSIENGNVTLACPGTMTVHAAEHLFEPAAVQPYYPLPQMPRQALTEVPARFNLRLSDAPGPDGVAMPNAEWRIVRAAQISTALLTFEALLSGQSNDQGQVELSDEQQATLKTAYDQAPNQYWLVSGSQAREVTLEADKGDWTEQKNLLKAMDAMGYSDSHFQIGATTVSAAHTARAQRDASTTSAEALINTLKDQ